MSGKETWNYFAEADPYYAVATYEKFRDENVNDERLDEFFGSGRAYVDKLWREIESLNEGDFRPQRALDFGCGVGRLTIPIAMRSEEAVGMDISPRMMEIAGENAKRQNVYNISFAESGDTLKFPGEGGFDLIHSFVVIQHIPAKTGEKLIAQMLEKLNPEGIGVLQITYKIIGSRMFDLYMKFPLLYKLRGLVKGRDKFLIPMYGYDLNRVFGLLQEHGCYNCRVRFTDHGSKGVMLIFKKTGEVFD